MPLKLQYDKKSSADCARWRAGIKLTEKMCPVFKKRCMGKKCMSFYIGHTYPTNIYKESKTITVYRIIAPHCNNAIVNGSIEMEVNQ